MSAISEIDKQIAKLQAEKEKLIAEQKEVALKRARDAVAELNALGYNYILSEATKSPIKRRTGVRQNVLNVVVNAPSGITSAAIAEQLGMIDKAGKQSISNALAALKKAGSVTAKDGVYRAV